MSDSKPSPHAPADLIDETGPKNPVTTDEAQPAFSSAGPSAQTRSPADLTDETATRNPVSTDEAQPASTLAGLSAQPHSAAGLIDEATPRNLDSTDDAQPASSSDSPAAKLRFPVGLIDETARRHPDSTDDLLPASSSASPDCQPSPSLSSSDGQAPMIPVVTKSLLKDLLENKSPGIVSFNLTPESPPESAESSDYQGSSCYETENSVDSSSSDSKLTENKDILAPVALGEIPLDSDAVSSPPQLSGLHQPSPEPECESDKSVVVGESNPGVNTLKEPEVCASHLERKQSTEKASLEGTESSLEKNKSEQHIIVHGETSQPSEDITSKSVESNLIEAVSKLPTESVEETSNLDSRLSEPGLFSPNTPSSGSSSGFGSQISLKNAPLVGSTEGSPQITLSDYENEASKSEVSQISANPVNLQSCTLVENLDADVKLLEPETSSQTQRKTSHSASQSIKEAAKNLDRSPGSAENETCSPTKKMRFDFSEILLQGSSTSTNQPSGSAFPNFMWNEFRTECKTVDRDLRMNTEFSEDLNAEGSLAAKTDKEKRLLRPIMTEVRNIYIALVQAKVFSRNRANNTLASNITENVQEFCSSFNAHDPNSVEGLIIEREATRHISELQMDPLQIRWYECLLLVDFLSRHSLSLLSLFLSADSDTGTQLTTYRSMFEKLEEFLNEHLLKLDEQRNQMLENDYAAVKLVNEQLTSLIKALLTLLETVYINM